MFPTKSGREFSPAFPKTAVHLYTQFLRIFAHLYHAHFRDILHLSLEAHLNVRLNRDCACLQAAQKADMLLLTVDLDITRYRSPSLLISSCLASRLSSSTRRSVAPRARDGASSLATSWT